MEAKDRKECNWGFLHFLLKEDRFPGGHRKSVFSFFLKTDKQNKTKDETKFGNLCPAQSLNPVKNVVFPLKFLSQ